ncbi:MAG TPA: hypothetical protein VGJ81_17170 [Thermoanaerobaculia bacterium]|jgi:hypothetical protein
MMPLTDQDFAEIRENVMREIARRERRNTWFLAASVALAAVVMVFVLVPRQVPENHAGEAAGAPLRTPPPIARSLSGAPAASPVQSVIATQTPPKKHHHRKPHSRPIAIASSEAQPMTIELQTANPDVRIIWIAK